MLIVIADDHNLVRESIADIVRGLKFDDSPVEVKQAGSYAELRTFRDSAPDLVLFDFNMPGVDGLRGVSEIVNIFAGIPAVIISGSIDSNLARGCLDAGAAGFIPKTVSMASLRNALRIILDGEKYIHAFALSASDPATQQAAASAPGNNRSLPHFSARESQIIELLIAGGTNKVIARQLSLQEMTVKTHVRNLYRKLGASNRADAVRIVLEARGSTAPTERKLIPASE